jgi:quercetin dioxygenase-like cupin family protein
MAIQGGAEIQDHTVHNPAVLHALRGRVTVHLEQGDVDLRAGEAITFASRVPHRLAAVEDAALLVLAGR